MSKQLCISSAISVVVMAAAALFSATGATDALRGDTPGTLMQAHAPAVPAFKLPFVR